MGVRQEEIKVGPLPAPPEPWLTPLDRATWPPRLSDHPAYRSWLFATLADIAEHFRGAAFVCEARNDADVLLVTNAARVLRSLAFALATRDNAWLASMGERAGACLRRESRELRVPTRVWVDGNSSSPSFTLPTGDIVLKRTEAADCLRSTISSVLIVRRNAATHPRIHREVAAELTEAFAAAVRAYPLIARRCSRLDALNALRKTFYAELDREPSRVLDLDEKSLSADERLRRILSEMEDVNLLAETFVVSGLRALGYPRAELRSFWDHTRKRAKLGEPTVKLMIGAEVLEPPWPFPSTDGNTSESETSRANRHPQTKRVASRTRERARNIPAPNPSQTRRNPRND
jgi:hypothetical protein